jgi:hypothetical protein
MKSKKAHGVVIFIGKILSHSEDLIIMLYERNKILSDYIKYNT